MAEAPDAYLNHWADQAAAKTIAAHPDASVFTVAAGITPSGVVHIGNFREVMTVDLVARALEDRGKKVRFIYSWDDFDVLRKVPEGMPKRDMLQENLRRSIADVPDPFGEDDSYAAHNIAAFEPCLQPLGIRPEFIRQHRKYRAGVYADGIKRALEGAAEIRRVLDKFRDKPLAADWLPLTGFCTSCGKDEIDLSWTAGYEVGVRCRLCSHAETVDLRKGGNLKLPWRVDWPMRWHHEKVMFEPGGKDHSSSGGSYDTGKEIVRLVYGWHAPEYVHYDFVRIKGRGGKISSSAGEVVTVEDALQVYEPTMLRWLFASYRANAEFQISFDADVLKLYEDYDRDRKLAHELPDGSQKDRKRLTARRLLDLASVDATRIEPGTEPPFQPAFRPLSMILQVYEGDLERTRAHYDRGGELRTAREFELFEQRARCVKNWNEHHAPEEFQFRIRREPTRRELSGIEVQVLARFVAGLREKLDAKEADLVPQMKTLFDGTDLTPQDFFPIVYDLLIARPKGPRLTTLIVVMGIGRAIDFSAPSAGT